MINYVADYEYIESNSTKLFTVVLLPDLIHKFPSVIIRTPYVDCYENESEENISSIYLNEYKNWLNHGYAVVIQHCRGTGKSDGDCIPYINECEDGIALQEWIRKQDFYNGELFLNGASYLTSVHYATAPFADNEHYVRHTNQKGLYSEQTEAKIAHNTVYLQKSVLTLSVGE